ncbi:fimbria/pilus outer membrane usher protein [Yersinia aleksiciae]|uniref:fimbria/pilus outer membrane usher protein n=1 Tax=Yersinia aleksiciae TaxID=263819 RepID=UPI001427B6F0|nr:fimbria/pilus outer membrane usher protein [Yersinia aleksiciae]MDA5496836.1 fimbrial biogenesis outer membrane usher protein [Yersinia aleksiciae]NIK98783.1 fimbrial biogenesis outer membrane usher protein [Yersinia aleksiciae]WQC72309.1 fimbria/pilus outer membrane usher protein [Yersinia aleksiciae]
MIIRFRLSPFLTLMYGSMIFPLLIPITVRGDDLPPPPSAAVMPDTTLYLELVVNGRNFGEAVPVVYRGGHYYLTPEQLKATGLPLPKSNMSEVAIDGMDKVKVKYQGDRQQLLIDIPSEWLPQQQVMEKLSDDYNLAKSSLGLLFNYDVYASQGSSNDQPGTVSAWTEQRIFDRFGVFSNTGVYRSALTDTDDITVEKGYVRYDTQWRFNDESHLLSYTAGDLITNSLAWSSSVRVGGLQLSRNFSIRPDLVTYPLPQFAGQAAIPSTVDLYIDNFRTQSASVNPGPFVIDNGPRINGAGQATIVTTDALGRQISTSIPFYVASELLKPGLWDFSISSGMLRQNYGIRSNDYADPVASGVVRYGVTTWMTLEGRADVAKQLNVTGGGIGLRAGNYGVLNGSYSISQAGNEVFGSGIAPTELNTDTSPPSAPSSYGGQGHQQSVGYSYSNSVFSLNAQRIMRSTNYGDLANYKSEYRLSRRTDQITGSLGLGAYGSIGTGYFDVRDALGERTRLVNLSYSTTLFGNTSFYLSVNRELGSQGYNAQMVFSLPLGEWGSGSISSVRDTNNTWSQRVNYSRATPTDGGLGWNMAYANGSGANSHYQQADLIWRTRAMETRVGVYGGEGDYQTWGEASGSLVMMNRSLYASNTINDAFALVSTHGFGQIPVSYENQLIGTTNDKGYLLIPNVTSYYQARFQIDPMSLPADVSMPEVERRLAISERSGYLIDFPMQQITAATLHIIDSSGADLPKGSPVYTTDAKPVSYVGWEGITYVEPANPQNKLKITRADNGANCYVQFALKSSSGIQDIGTVTCK